LNFAVDESDTEHAALIGKKAREATVIPKHENGTLAGVLSDTAPRKSALGLEQRSRADKIDITAAG